MENSKTVNERVMYNEDLPENRRVLPPIDKKRKEKSKDEKGWVSYDTIYSSKSPTKDICDLAVSTFEKMELSQLRTLEQLSDTLNVKEKISLEQLITFTMKTMTTIWQDNTELEALLNSNNEMTYLLGQELLVLFDNIMLRSGGSISNGKPQRYAKTCLGNSIQHIDVENIPAECLHTYETVISSYTSPDAFTPEMESLLYQASKLGIATEELNLKNFATERSIAAYLKKVINAKSKKSAFITQFNDRLINVLTNVPNADSKRLQNKFKNSFSKFYEYSIKHKEEKTKSKLSLYQQHERKGLYNNKANVSTLENTDRLMSIESEKFQKKSEPQKSSPERTICKKCHYPMARLNEKGIQKSLSDTMVSTGSGDSVTLCRCFDRAKKVWDKRSKLSKPETRVKSNTTSTLSKLNKKNKTSKIIEKSSVPPKLPQVKDNPITGLLSEQKSFIKLGKGAKHDAVSEYVKLKETPTKQKTNGKAESPANTDSKAGSSKTNAKAESPTNTDSKAGSSKTNAEKKKVRWIDQNSLESIYDSVIDFDSDDLEKSPAKAKKETSKSKVSNTIPVGTMLPASSQEQSVTTVALSAVTHATIAFVIASFLAFLYSFTPGLADKLKYLEAIKRFFYRS